MGSGKYLNLRKKDEEVQIRIVSTPKHKTKHWVLTDAGKNKPIDCTDDEGCPWCGKDVPDNEKIDRRELFAWLVIDRKDGKIKMFSGPALVYTKIKKYFEDSNWGDPKNYDIKIKRAEDPGVGYYEVMALPKGMGPISKAEKKLVNECDIDLGEELKEGKDTKTFGKDSDGNLETVAPVEGEDEDIDPDKENGDNDDIPF